MINPFDYLFYKIYRAWSHLSFNGEPIGHLGVMTFLLLSNVLTIYLLIFGEILPEQVALISGFLIAATLFVSYRPKREARILSRFEKESKERRIIGNTIVILYTIISIIACILTLKYC